MKTIDEMNTFLTHTLRYKQVEKYFSEQEKEQSSSANDDFLKFMQKVEEKEDELKTAIRVSGAEKKEIHEEIYSQLIALKKEITLFIEQLQIKYTSPKKNVIRHFFISLEEDTECDRVSAIKKHRPMHSTLQNHANTLAENILHIDLEKTLNTPPSSVSLHLLKKDLDDLAQAAETNNPHDRPFKPQEIPAIAKKIQQQFSAFIPCLNDLPIYEYSMRLYLFWLDLRRNNARSITNPGHLASKEIHAIILFLISFYNHDKKIKMPYDSVSIQLSIENISRFLFGPLFYKDILLLAKTLHSRQQFTPENAEALAKILFSHASDTAKTRSNLFQLLTELSRLQLISHENFSCVKNISPEILDVVIAQLKKTNESSSKNLQEIIKEAEEGLYAGFTAILNDFSH